MKTQTGTLRMGFAILTVTVMAPLSIYLVLSSGAGDASKGRMSDDAGDVGVEAESTIRLSSREGERPAPASSESLAVLAKAFGADIPLALNSSEDLERFVDWLKALSSDELLQLSNAEFDFKDSTIIKLLQSASGEWLVPALGGLAVAETNELLKAVLVEGLCGGFQFERVEDPRLVPLLDQLMGQLSFEETDPYGVGRSVIDTTSSVALRQGLDYVGLVEHYLVESDNPMFVLNGYMFAGMFPGSETLLVEMVTAHQSAEGRMGALEGLRQAVIDGNVSPERVTEVGLQALAEEESGRNQLLLLEMVSSVGGEAGLDALATMLAVGDSDYAGTAAQLLAARMEPKRALGLLELALSSDELDEDLRDSLFAAMGSLPDRLGAPLLLDVATDPDRSDAERLAGLKGLWNIELDDALMSQLKDVLHESEDSAMRAEALRMLSSAEAGLSSDNLRELASLDPDPGVRAEAVMLASMQAGADSREWLEQRLWEDASVNVQAAALGALVMQAHYTGGGEAALSYLDLAETLTTDPDVLRMIESGRTLVSNYDPRTLEFELAEDARFWSKMADLTGGAASRGFRRRGRQLGRFVATLRASR